MPSIPCESNVTFNTPTYDDAGELPVLRDYQAKFLAEEMLPLDLAGKRLLEVGAGEGALCRHLASSVPTLREIVALNVEPAAAQHGRNWSIVTMDARELEFADESFDVVYSLATFEHIDDLGVAFSQMRRVLRPGGQLVSVWSPLWNGFSGHHFGPTMSHEHHRAIALPWAHHILGSGRLADYLATGEGFTQDQAEAAVEFIFGSPWLNRLSYGDYRTIIGESGMREVRVDGVKVDFAGALSAIEKKIAAGHVSPEEVLRFFRRFPEDELLVYKMRISLRR